MSIYDLVIESKFYNNDKIADFENNYDGLRVGVLGGLLTQYTMHI